MDKRTPLSTFNTWGGAEPQYEELLMVVFGDHQSSSATAVSAVCTSVSAADYINGIRVGCCSQDGSYTQQSSRGERQVLLTLFFR